MKTQIPGLPDVGSRETSNTSLPPGFEPEDNSFMFQMAQEQFDDYMQRFDPEFDINEAAQWENKDDYVLRSQHSAGLHMNHRDMVYSTVSGFYDSNQRNMVISNRMPFSHQRGANPFVSFGWIWNPHYAPPPGPAPPSLRLGQGRPAVADPGFAQRPCHSHHNSRQVHSRRYTKPQPTNWNHRRFSSCGEHNNNESMETVADVSCESIVLNEDDRRYSESQLSSTDDAKFEKIPCVELDDDILKTEEAIRKENQKTDDDAMEASTVAQQDDSPKITPKHVFIKMRNLNDSNAGNGGGNTTDLAEANRRCPTPTFGSEMKLCRKFAMGHCDYGVQCRFAHVRHQY